MLAPTLKESFDDDVDEGRVWQQNGQSRPALEVDFNIDSGSYLPEGATHTMTSLARMWLPEGVESANLHPSGNDFTTTDWTRTNITITGDAIANPVDGKVTAHKIEVTTTALTSFNTSTPGRVTITNMPGWVRLRAYVKRGNNGDTEANNFVIRNTTQAVNVATVTNFNWATGAATPTAGTTFSAVDVGDGWWRIEFRTSDDAFEISDEAAVYIAYSGGSENAGVFVYAYDVQLTTQRGQWLGFAPHNFFPHSDEFDDAAWAKNGGATITPNDGVGFGPNGEDMDLISGLATQGTDRLHETGVAPYADYPSQIGIYIRRVSTSGIMRLAHSGGTSSGHWQVDLSQLEDGVTEWINRDHPAVTVVTEWKTNASSQAGMLIERDTTGAAISFHAIRAVCALGPQTIAMPREWVPDSGGAAYYGPGYTVDLQTGRRGVQMFQSRTGELTQSGNVSHADWTKANTATLAQDATGVDGSTSAVTLLDSGATGIGTVEVRQALSVTSGNLQTVYAIVKKDQLDWCQLVSSGFDGGTARSNFDLTNGVTGTIEHTSAGITLLPGGRYLCWFTFSSTTDVNGTVHCRVADGNASVNVDLDGTSSIIVDEFQSTEGTMPTPAILTQTSSEARDTESFSIPIPASLSTALATAGTIIVEFVLFGSDSDESTASADYRFPCQLHDGTNNNRVQFYSGSSGTFERWVSSGGGTQMTGQLRKPTALVIAAGTVCRAAITWGGGSGNSSINGVEGTEDATVTGPVGLTTLEIGGSTSATQKLNGMTLKVTIFDHKMTDEEMNVRTAA